MRILPGFAALLLLLPCGIFAQSPAPTIQPIPWTAPTGSTQLWNGQDLTGWTSFFAGGITAPSTFWSAMGGVLHLEGKPKGYIRTVKDYSNYHLHAEWRWVSQPPKGVNNSGIFVFQKAPDAVWPYSVQVQVKAGSCGDLIAQGGLLFTPATPPPLTQTLKKHTDTEKPMGEWNGYDVYCRGASIALFVNGTQQNFVDKLAADSGQIALQMEGYPIEFRNLWLEPLPPSP
jgi:hypothetical protein